MVGPWKYRYFHKNIARERWVQVSGGDKHAGKEPEHNNNDNAVAKAYNHGEKKEEEIE